MSAAMKFMRRTVKYTRQNYETNEDILSEIKINSVLKKIQNYRNKWIKHVRRMDRDRLPHLIMKCQPCGKRRQEWSIKRLLGCSWDRKRSRGQNLASYLMIIKQHQFIDRSSESAFRRRPGIVELGCQSTTRKGKLKSTPETSYILQLREQKTST